MSEAKAGNVAQEKMQKFGRFLSGMVMPNIGAFIAWGLLTALFIPTGWIPSITKHSSAATPTEPSALTGT